MNTRQQNSPEKLFNTFSVFCYKHLIEPRSTDEDNRRREFILNILVVGMLALSTIFDLFILWDCWKEKDTPDIPFMYFTIIISLFVFLLVLSRKGKSCLASYLLIASLFIGATYAMYRWGVGVHLAILFYVLIITMSGILIGTRFGFWVTIGLSACIIILSHLQIHGIIAIVDTSIRTDTSKLYWKLDPERQLAEHISLVFLLIMTISWLSNREMEKSLARARISERELKKERDMLEITVQEKVLELRQMEAEKISQLYRLAEFGKLSSGLFHDLINPFNVVALHVEQLRIVGNEHAHSEAYIDNQAKTSSVGVNKTITDATKVSGVKADEVKADEVKAALKKAVRAGAKMQRFLSAIQKQIETVNSRKKFSLNNEIEEVADLLDYRAKKAGVEIQFFAENEYWINGNPLKFSQAIFNLITNGIDSYHQLKHRDRKVVTITITESISEYILLIKDYGCGITAQNSRKLFNPFFTTKKVGGTGLGLFTTQNIIEQEFCGTISISQNSIKHINIEEYKYSGTGEVGSTITLSLPK
jgi:signal transduction histidine kinase